MSKVGGAELATSIELSKVKEEAKQLDIESLGSSIESMAIF